MGQAVERKITLSPEDLGQVVEANDSRLDGCGYVMVFDPAKGCRIMSWGKINTVRKMAKECLEQSPDVNVVVSKVEGCYVGPKLYTVIQNSKTEKTC